MSRPFALGGVQAEYLNEHLELPVTTGVLTGHPPWSITEWSHSPTDVEDRLGRSWIAVVGGPGPGGPGKGSIGGFQVVVTQEVHELLVLVPAQPEEVE